MDATASYVDDAAKGPSEKARLYQSLREPSGPCCRESGMGLRMPPTLRRSFSTTCGN